MVKIYLIIPYKENAIGTQFMLSVTKEFISMKTFNYKIPPILPFPK